MLDFFSEKYSKEKREKTGFATRVVSIHVVGFMLGFIFLFHVAGVYAGLAGALSL